MDNKLIYWSNGEQYQAFADACAAQATPMKEAGIAITTGQSSTDALFEAKDLGRLHISASAQFGYLAPVKSNILATAILFGVSRQFPFMIVVLDAQGRVLTTGRKREFLLSMVRHLDRPSQDQIMRLAHLSPVPRVPTIHSSNFPEEQFVQADAIQFA